MNYSRLAQQLVLLCLVLLITGCGESQEVAVHSEPNNSIPVEVQQPIRTVSKELLSQLNNYNFKDNYTAILTTKGGKHSLTKRVVRLEVRGDTMIQLNASYYNQGHPTYPIYTNCSEYINEKRSCICNLTAHLGKLLEGNTTPACDEFQRTNLSNVQTREEVFAWYTKELQQLEFVKANETCYTFDGRKDAPINSSDYSKRYSICLTPRSVTLISDAHTFGQGNAFGSWEFR
jgi:hypothetical protein